MKLSSFVLATGIALGSASAMAATIPVDVSSGSSPFGNTPTALGFSDTFTFTLASASTLVASFSAPAGATQDVDVFGAFLTGPSGLFSFTQVVADPFEFYTLSTGLLSAGSYAITVLGTNTATIGSYGGSIVVSAVPEPESYALLFAGLLAVGFVSRRRI